MVSATDIEPQEPPMIEVRDLDFAYGAKLALEDINLKVARHRVTALIGPSGCGKSTLLRCINRMNQRLPGAHIRRGSIRIEGHDIHDPRVSLTLLRQRVGMVFQKSNPFPKSIHDNVAFGLRIAGVSDPVVLDEAVERALRAAALWDELKDRLHQHAHSLSGGQQQRLCIARAVATRPAVLLMDEPCSALDPIATLKIEELLGQLAQEHTVVIVTHNMQQAVRVSHDTAFLHLGRLVEHAPTAQLFDNPQQALTEAYLRGTF
jgi:phosphate transport system ATP-binding protein